MKKRIVNAFSLLMFGVILFSYTPGPEMLKECQLGNEQTEQLNIENEGKLRAGISEYTTDIGNMNSYAEVVSEKIISTASAAPEDISDDTILISYDNYYVKGTCNVMKDHTYDSEILYSVSMNDVIYASNPIFNDGEIAWSYVAYRNEAGEITLGFIDNNELSTEPIASTDYTIPTYSGYKSYMSYRQITSPSAPAYKLEQISYTGEEGIRMYDGRYLIALGLHFNASVGDYVDLELANGTIIPCIIGDRKAWFDTDQSLLFTANGCMSEFIVQIENLSHDVTQHGNISYTHEEWKSPVQTVKIYQKNVFN